MKERPILFSAPMVRAILDGRKTMTRRVIKLADGSLATEEDIPAGGANYVMDFSRHFPKWKRLDCPYGQPGDRLWVRENIEEVVLGSISTARYCADNAQVMFDGNMVDNWWYSRRVCPSIHMPRWASRIDLEITGIRVERLQDISREDAKKEGIPEYYRDALDIFQGGFPAGRELHVWDNHTTVENFQWLWDSINGKSPGKAWADNPWTWVVEFEVVKP